MTRKAWGDDVARRWRSLMGAVVAVLALAPAPSEAVHATCGVDHRGGYDRARALTASVVVYGDSITAQSRALLPHAWGYDARWGRTTAATLARLRADVRLRAQHLPETVVMAVGTNDLRRPEAMSQLVEDTRRLLPRTVRLVWVDVYVERRPGWQAVDAGIRAVPGIPVVGWAAANEAATRGGPSPLLDGGGTHLSCRGARVRVALIERAVAVRFARET